MSYRNEAAVEIAQAMQAADYLRQESARFWESNPQLGVDLLGQAVAARQRAYGLAINGDYEVPASIRTYLIELVKRDLDVIGHLKGRIDG